jgi:hypothetical protein
MNLGLLRLSFIKESASNTTHAHGCIDSLRGELKKGQAQRLIKSTSICIEQKILLIQKAKVQATSKSRVF